MKDRGIIPLCGAGISNSEDVKIAMDLGVNGVLVASAIAKAPLKKAKKLLMEISTVK